MNCDHCGDPLRVNAAGFFVSANDGSTVCVVSVHGHALDGEVRR